MLLGLTDKQALCHAEVSERVGRIAEASLYSYFDLLSPKDMSHPSSSMGPTGFVHIMLCWKSLASVPSYTRFGTHY